MTTHQYNPKQFKSAVKYIAKHNPHFLDKRVELEGILTRLINNAVEYDKKCNKECLTYVSTAGFTVFISTLGDGIEQIEILVDPSVGKGNEPEVWHA